MSRIEVKSGHRRQRVAIARRTRRLLRPSLLALEGRTLLSTIVVNNPTDIRVTGQTDLRQAIAQADTDGGGDTIVFSSLFNSPQKITLTGGQLELSGTMAATTITGPGANLLSVSGNNASRVFLVDANVSASISGLTITDGNAGEGGSGGGLYNLGTLSLSDCTVSGNSAGSFGGGLDNFGALSLAECTVSGNSAELGNGAGLYNQAGTATLTDCTVSGNSAKLGNGAGLINNGTASLTLTDCTVSGNTAGVNGGGLFNDGTATLTNCTVSGNSAKYYGGLLNNGAAALSLTNTIVAGNRDGDISGSYLGSNNLIGGDPLLAPLGDYGGPTPTMALLPGSPAIGKGTSDGAPAADQRGLPLASPRPDIGAFQTNPLVVNSTVDGTGSPSGDLSLRQAVNLANALGGTEAITFDPTVFATPQTITLDGNQLELESGTVTITGPGANLLSVSGNKAGRVFQVDAKVIASILGLTITGGNADTDTDDGGGVQVEPDGGLTMTDCTISDSATSGQSGIGGGLVCFPDGTLTMKSCTVSGNNAVGGGGLFNDGGTLTMTNCTVGDNSSTGRGGGLGNFGTFHPASLTLTDCTFSGNSAAKGGGGLYNTGGSATLTSTIVAGNGGSDVLGNYTDGGDNLISGNPLLAVLGDYGGPTFTMPPLPGSPAIGGGTTTDAPATDQRGQPRTGRIDIGAFQTQPNIIVNTTADGVGSSPGELNLRQAINLANALPTADTITFSSLFNTPQTITLTAGELKLTDKATTTISGPGASLLSISGGDATRCFATYGEAAAALSGLTITGGRANRGGGLQNIDGTVSMIDCVVSGNASVGPAGYLGGGGLYNDGGSLALTDCTISGNTADGVGGGILQPSGEVTLTGCTISGNTAPYGNGGGICGAVGDTSLSLTSCTITGNTAGRDGGGLYSLGSISGSISLTNCTVSGNSCGEYGGGLALAPALLGKAWLNNTIVAGNVAHDGGNDVLNGISGSYNLIGSGAAMSGINDGSQGNQVGTAQAPIDPLMAPLGNYGGPTFTMALLPGSPAIGGGTTAGAPATDQRGEPRSGHVDIGAFQSQGFKLTPVAGSSPQSAAVGTSFAKPLAVTVTANNPIEPVDGGVISFGATPAAGGALATISAATATIQSGQAAVTATANDTQGSYSVTATAAGASSASFSLTNLAASSLSETPPPTQPTGPSEQVVTDLAGLRAAIAFANSHPGPDTILLDPTGSGAKPKTIQISGGPLVITNPATTTIIGPGARLLTIASDGRSGVFDIEGGSVALSGLAIARGRAESGGGILNDGGSLSLTDVILRDNSARALGGGLYNNGDAKLTNVTVSDDSARVGGGIANSGTLSLTDVRVRGNTARVGSGVFNIRKATLAWLRSPARRGSARISLESPEHKA